MKRALTQTPAAIGLTIFLLCKISVASSGEFIFDAHTLTVPDGFVVERVAPPSLSKRPTTFDFDEQGRLYVAESSGSNDSVEQQLAEKPHSILRLEDTDGDGVFDHKTVFADRMMFPAGTLWHDGSLYVTAPPEIWKLTDTDDDGVADEREVWLNPGTLTGCANDLHGPYLGPDGWIYWTKGAFAEQKFALTAGGTFKTRAAHIFRRHPSGGGVEPVMTGGMDNPVEVAFSRGGERFFSTTFFQHPGGGRRDGLIHAIYGGVYGKIHNVIEDHPRTGEILEPMTHLGPAAACALIRYESDAFGPHYHDNLFSSSFNLKKVSRHRLIPTGATFRTLDEDFLVSDNPDFHVTHITEDADGSLIIADTGGWYKLCCPTSQLHKPDVFGAIYRVRLADAKSVDDPRGLKLDWNSPTPNDLASRLEDPRWTVRKRAVNHLGKRGPTAVPALSNLLAMSADANARAESIWALTRIDGPDARAATIRALDDSNETVRQAAIHSIALWRSETAVPHLIRLLDSESPQIRRVAAEALGRIGNPSSVPALLATSKTTSDRTLEHSLIYALIEIADPDATRAGLASDNASTRRAALIALDQMPGGGLPASAVTPLLTSENEPLRETAEWLIGRHDDWGPELATYFEARITATGAEVDTDKLVEMLGGFANDAAVQQVIAAALASDRATSRTIALDAINTAELNWIPDAWVPPLDRLLDSGSPSFDPSAVEICRRLPLAKGRTDVVIARLIGIARSADLEAGLRLGALAAIPASKLVVDDAIFGFLIDMITDDASLSSRSVASKILAGANLDSDRLVQLAAALRVVQPMDLTALLPAYANVSDGIVGLALVRALESASAMSSVRREIVEPCVRSFPDEVRTRFEALLASLESANASQREQLDTLLNELGEGDIRRGQALFNSPQLACATCHAIGYLGGTLGPDLTTIGTVRTERDLLEAVLFPSASFVRSYEPVMISTTDGATYLGMIKDDGVDEITLEVGVDARVRIPRDEIASMEPGSYSLMPEGLTASLGKSKLADLIAFLKATRWR